MIPLKDKPVVMMENKFLKPSELIEFFRDGFSENEDRFRTPLLLQSMMGLRISEILAINIRDVVTEFNEDVWVINVNIAKKKENCIEKRVINAMMTAILKQYCIKWWAYIISNNGFIFPHVSNNRFEHMQPSHIQNFICKKRKILFKQNPEKWHWILDTWRQITYSTLPDNSFKKKNKIENRYKLSSHAFRRFFITHISEDPKEAQSIIKHCDLKTTFMYRDIYTSLRKEYELANKLGSPEFFDAIQPVKPNVPAVWHSLKNYD